MFKKLKEFLFGTAEAATPDAPYKVEAPAATTITKAPVITAAKSAGNTVKKSVPKKPAVKKPTAAKKPRARKAAKPGHN